MQIIKSISEMQELAQKLLREDKSTALVPTMGALHTGHLSLVKKARDEADLVIVTIYVNSAQFGPNEDFGKYPRTIEKDIEACEKEGVDIIFIPEEQDIYPKGYSTYVQEEALAKGLCGISRPGHFGGVCTVLAKLFNICMPDVAVFGQKDAQQCAIIKRMVQDLNFNISIVIAPTVREPDGLALSSRNAYLSEPQREEALKIYKALSTGKELVEKGVRQVNRLEAEVTHHLTGGRRLRVIYVSIVDKDTLQPLEAIEPGKTLIAVAVWVDEVRLIDNIII